MVTFTLLTTYKNTIDFTDLGIAMGLEYAYQNLIDGVSPSYIDPPGGFILNNEAEYDAITWTDIRTKPTWAILTGAYYLSWKNVYKNQTITYGIKQDIYASMDKPALDLKADLSALTITNSNLSSLSSLVSTKADTSAVNTALGGKASSSHTHAQSDIIGLSSALALKVDGVGLEMNKQGITDSNSRITLHLTDTGLSGGNALWSVINPPTVIPNIKKNATITDPNAVMSITEELWSNGNKTVTFIVTKGTSTGILLGGTVNSEALVGSGITVDFQIFGAKA